MVNHEKNPYGYGLSRNSLTKLYMNRANVRKASFYLSISSFVLLGIWTLIKKLLQIDTYIVLDSYIVALAFFLWGYVGLFWAYRRQVPQIVTLKGKPAFLIGISMMVVGWSLALYSLADSTQIMLATLLK